MEITKKIKVSVKINAPVEKVWKLWTEPQHVMRWNRASDDWHTPRAENDLRQGGKFVYRMEAKDGTSGFDFSGTYLKTIPFSYIEYSLDDGRKVSVTFNADINDTLVEEIFESESVNPPELQYSGWQSILNNFKVYVESQ